MIWNRHQYFYQNVTIVVAFGSGTGYTETKSQARVSSAVVSCSLEPLQKERDHDQQSKRQRLL